MTLGAALTDGDIRLEPLRESHRAALGAACAEDLDIWPIYASSYDPDHFDAAFDRRQVLYTFVGVRPRPGEFVVNLGDMMARWTNGSWASTLHRVVNPPLGMAQSRRLSIGMFVHPNYDQRIECVPTCLAPGEKPRYDTISAGEHIKRKIERSHEAA